MFILLSVFFSLHTNNKVQQSPLGGKHPQNTSTTNSVSIGFTQYVWNQCSDKKKN